RPRDRAAPARLLFKPARTVFRPRRRHRSRRCRCRGVRARTTAPVHGATDSASARHGGSRRSGSKSPEHDDLSSIHACKWTFLAPVANLLGLISALTGLSTNDTLYRFG